MTDPLRARLETRVAAWRNHANSEGAIDAQGIEECADALEAALRAAPSADIGVSVDPDRIRVEVVEPGLVRLTAVRTGQLFLHRVVPESPESRIARAAAPEETP